MKFLDAFSPTNRAAMEATAHVVSVKRGQTLFRRGEPGGDVYLLREGALDIVDSRINPEVVLASLTEGAVVGELSFVDGSPRSADVRATSDGAVLRWPRDDLRALLERDPSVGSAFYEAVARQAAIRLRDNVLAIRGALDRTEARSAGIEGATEEAKALAERTKAALLEAETRLRNDPADKDAAAAVRAALDRLEAEILRLSVAWPDPAEMQAGAKTLSRELHPYLVRSSLAERCLRRTHGVSGAPEVLAHVLVDSARGEGQLGELLDRWLLDRPTFRAFRAFREPVLDLLQSRLPKHRNRRVLLLPASTGSLVTSLAHALGHAPTLLTVVDQSREALALLDSGLPYRPRAVTVEPSLERLVPFLLGDAHRALPPQDAIVLNGVLEYLPDRHAIATLAAMGRRLAEGGVIIASALASSDDADLLDWLLHWPSSRRSLEQMHRLVRAAGLVAEPSAAHAPALRIVARLPDGAMVAPAEIPS